MARENIAKFEEQLKNDESAQARLQELVNAYEGDKADEQAFFDATVGKLAAEVGLPFSLEEGKELASSQELSDAELEAVSGGDPCFIFGGADGAEAHCQHIYGMACAYLGVTFN